MGMGKWEMGFVGHLVLVSVLLGCLVGGGNGAGIVHPPGRRAASNEGASPLVRMTYHMGPVLTGDIRVYIIWYGTWKETQKRIIRDFFASVSASAASPSVHGWWSTARLYTDQTGRNISGSLRVAGELSDRKYSQGRALIRIQVNDVIKSALDAGLPKDGDSGAYFVFTSPDVVMQDFCLAVCGFHYFTFPSIVGATLPYAWVGNSEKQCPEWCAYPFAVAPFMRNVEPMLPPNGQLGIDAMISVIGHELAEMASNPLANAWYAGDDARAPNEIADLCEGIYGPGGGGGYPGEVLHTHAGASYNMKGVGRRKFLVQWLWSPILNACTGPNAKVSS